MGTPNRILTYILKRYPKFGFETYASDMDILNRIWNKINLYYTTVKNIFVFLKSGFESLIIFIEQNDFFHGNFNFNIFYNF